MRAGIADAVLVAIIALISTIITVVAEKEADYPLTKILYQEDNKTQMLQCEQYYQHR